MVAGWDLCFFRSNQAVSVFAVGDYSDDRSIGQLCRMAGVYDCGEVCTGARDKDGELPHGLRHMKWKGQEYSGSLATTWIYEKALALIVFLDMVALNLEHVENFMLMKNGGFLTI